MPVDSCMDTKTRISKQALADQDDIVSWLRRRRGYACASMTIGPGALGRQILYIMNDSAGKSSIQSDESFRGGGVWLFTKNALYTRWSNTRWTEQQLEKHSTETEIANANCSLHSLISSHKGYDIIEVLDNRSAVQTLRRLGCTSTSLEDQLKYRLEILASAELQSTRVFTVWSCREHGTLADMLSKDEIDAFTKALAKRGLPPPAAVPFKRVAPRM